jgi:hypothetical protein
VSYGVNCKGKAKGKAEVDAKKAMGEGGKRRGGVVKMCMVWVLVPE